MAFERSCTQLDQYTLLLHFLSTCSSPRLFSSALFLLALFVMWLLVALLTSWAYPGGPAWGMRSFFDAKPATRHLPPIPGPRGLPVLGSLLSFAGTRSYTAHRRLAALASSHNACSLMALSLGSSTRVVVTSQPSVAGDILCSPAFAERPLTQSAQQLLFGRAVGFAPYGDHWRSLRRLAASHLFSPRRIAAHEHTRQLEASIMLDALASRVHDSCVQKVRPYLQHAALNNILATVFGRRYTFSEQSSADFDCSAAEASEVQSMVREGFELLGAFNMADHLPAAFECVDPLRIRQRCDELVPRVYAFVQKIVNEHRRRGNNTGNNNIDSCDFVDVLLGLEGLEKLADSDMVSILWEMIFRGTDTMAILTEWILAELVLNPAVQAKLHAEIEAVVGMKGGTFRDADVSSMPYLQAVVKEGLRLHPPGPLLSWARLAIHDVEVAGHHVPAGTTAMVNMWAITHDPTIWSEPEKFVPERFLPMEGGTDVDVRGSDLRLAPFGAGARVCPGKALALATVHLWVAKIVQRFHLSIDDRHPVDLTEILKLSCEMAVPLSAHFTDRKAAPGIVNYNN